MKQTDDDNGGVEHPWLEYFPEGSTRVQCVPLDKTSVTIGRAETAEVQIDSTRVSREHARIVCEDETFIIRDLGSTNGTFVNGEQIEEASLTNGDVFVVADIEFAFLTCATSQLRHMATQQMPTAPSGHRNSGTHPVDREVRDAVLALRQAHQQLVQGFVPLDLLSIVEQPAELELALLLQFSIPAINSKAETSFLRPPNQALMRLYEVQRQKAIEFGAQLPDCSQIVVPLESWEISENESLLWHFEALSTTASDSVFPIVSLKATDVVDLPDVQQFCKDLQDIGFVIACNDFVGSHAQVQDLAELQPEFLFLSSKLIGDLPRSAQHQDRLASIADMCSTLGILPVVGHDLDPQVNELCLQLGVVRFVQERDTAQQEVECHEEMSAPLMPLV